MKNSRRLTLRREALAEIAPGQLSEVPGGSGPGGSCGTCITQCDCASLDRCPTIPARECLSLGADPCINGG